MKKNVNKKIDAYPLYPSSDDIYNKSHQETNFNTDNPKIVDDGIVNQDANRIEMDLDNNLDVPGAELDDIQENIGSEDEENNYYSLGGDDHSDLDENNES